MAIETKVFHKKEGDWNDIQNKRNVTLIETGKPIKPGLVDRLLRYATQRMKENGFPVTDNVEVSTTEGEGYYHVAFINEKGGNISVGGILIGRGGHPSLDHGFYIEPAPWSAT